jgi:pimeloyl-ACP methyl ester carboxylesterase
MLVCLQWLQGAVTLLTSLLYFKQKYAPPHPSIFKAKRNRALIYPSHVPVDARTAVPRPSEFELPDFEELMIPTPDGEKLSAFYIRAPQTARKKNLTVLMFHGNAGNIGHRIPIARVFVRSMGCSVFMLEYRGYGMSTGSPDERGIMIDAQTAYEYLRNRAETRDNDIVVYGQSLGGAVSIQLVAKNQNDKKLVGLVLENTFLSMRKLIPSYVLLAMSSFKLIETVSSHQPATSHSSAINYGPPTHFSPPSPKYQSSSSPVSKMRSSRKFFLF